MKKLVSIVLMFFAVSAHMPTIKAAPSIQESNNLFQGTLKDLKLSTCLANPNCSPKRKAEAKQAAWRSAKKIAVLAGTLALLYGIIKRDLILKKTNFFESADPKEEPKQKLKQKPEISPIEKPNNIFKEITNTQRFSVPETKNPNIKKMIFQTYQAYSNSKPVDALLIVPADKIRYGQTQEKCSPFLINASLVKTAIDMFNANKTLKFIRFDMQHSHSIHKPTLYLDKQRKLKFKS